MASLGHSEFKSIRCKPCYYCSWSKSMNLPELLEWLGTNSVIAIFLAPAYLFTNVIFSLKSCLALPQMFGAVASHLACEGKNYTAIKLKGLWWLNIIISKKGVALFWFKCEIAYNMDPGYQNIMAWSCYSMVNILWYGIQHNCWKLINYFSDWSTISSTMHTTKLVMLDLLADNDVNID